MMRFLALAGSAVLVAIAATTPAKAGDYYDGYYGGGSYYDSGYRRGYDDYYCPPRYPYYSSWQYERPRYSYESFDDTGYSYYPRYTGYAEGYYRSRYRHDGYYRPHYRRHSGCGGGLGYHRNCGW